MALPFKVDKTGVFKLEVKNRFRGVVYVDGRDELCYIQSSSRLSNYIDLMGKKVLLYRNKSDKLKYTILCEEKKHDYMLLCPLLANDIIISELNRRIFSFLGERKRIIREYKILNYKSDIYIPETNTIIEIKSFISEKNIDYFPTIKSDRTLSQMSIFDDLLDKNYKVVLIICAFNPYQKEIIINQESEFYAELKESLKKGLIIKGFSISCKNNEIKIQKELKIIY